MVKPKSADNYVGRPNNEVPKCPLKPNSSHHPVLQCAVSWSRATSVMAYWHAVQCAVYWRFCCVTRWHSHPLGHLTKHVIQHWLCMQSINYLAYCRHATLASVSLGHWRNFKLKNVLWKTIWEAVSAFRWRDLLPSSPLFWIRICYIYIFIHTRCTTKRKRSKQERCILQWPLKVLCYITTKGKNCKSGYIRRCIRVCMEL